MAIFRKTETVAAGAVVTNLFSGDVFEFLGRPAVVNLWASQDGPGAPNAELDFNLGNVMVSNSLRPNTNSVVGDAGNISRDKDGIGGGAGDAGDRVQLKVRNADAANPVNINVLVEIQDLV